MAIKNLGTITSICQKKNNKKVEKTIQIRLDLNAKEDENKEYNIYISDTENAKLLLMNKTFSINEKFDISLNKKYVFELDKSLNSIIGLTESLEK